MISRTKSYLTTEQIVKLFSKAGIEGITSVAPLGAGEFNAVYAVDAGGKGYAIKIAPTAEVLPYERGMMAAEAYWYRRIREDTDINVPTVYYYDDSHTDIPSDYFIMDRVEGEQADTIKLSAAEKTMVEEEICHISANLNKVKGDKFGYVQMGLHDNWYEAIRAIVQSCIDAAEAKGRKTENGELLLKYIDNYADVLKKVDSRLVNIDLWLPNVIVKRVDGELRFWLIDPERCLWGDALSGFMCMQMMVPDLFKKTKALAAYNAVADEPITFDAESNIRYAVMMAYTGLIMEVEKYYRYTPLHFGWWRNVVASKFMFYRTGFSILKKGV